MLDCPPLAVAQAGVPDRRYQVALMKFRSIFLEGTYYTLLEGQPKQCLGPITVSSVHEAGVATGRIGDQNVIIVLLEQPAPRTGETIVAHGYGTDDVFYSLAWANLSTGASTPKEAMGFHDRLQSACRKYLLFGLLFIPLVLPAYYLITAFRMRRYMRRIAVSVEAVQSLVDHHHEAEKAVSARQL